MSSLTAAGELRKSRLDDPTPMQRFLVGSQNTSHLKIIPVLGYFKQQRRCLWIA
jgi:hypothetical protein